MIGDCRDKLIKEWVDKVVKAREDMLDAYKINNKIDKLREEKANAKV